jgi:RNA polymerase sigma-70 factor (ECF subfamily)
MGADTVANSSAQARPADDDAIFRDLVAAHGQRLFRFVLRRIGNATEAEDLAQQAFVEAAQAYRGFRGDSQLSTWLYGIAMNLVRNHLSRAPCRLYAFEDESTLEQQACARPDPERQYELSGLMRLLDRELATLMPEMREVLLLVALDDISYEDAAALLSLPIGTVRSRISRARTQLRRRFAESGAVLPF